MNNVKAIQEITKRELEFGNEGKSSWHYQYKNSAYVYIGGLDYDLTEGDILSVFSQYGEIVNINLVRDKKTGKSKGFCFIGYEDQQSTILSVDNLNGIKLCGRVIRVDHVKDYRRPKDEHGNEIIEKGCAPKTPTPSPSPSPPPLTRVKKDSEEKQRRKKKKHKKRDDREYDETNDRTKSEHFHKSKIIQDSDNLEFDEVEGERQERRTSMYRSTKYNDSSKSYGFTNQRDRKKIEHCVKDRSKPSRDRSRSPGRTH